MFIMHLSFATHVPNMSASATQFLVSPCWNYVRYPYSILLHNGHFLPLVKLYWIVFLHLGWGIFHLQESHKNRDFIICICCFLADRTNQIEEVLVQVSDFKSSTPQKCYYHSKSNNISRTWSWIKLIKLHSNGHILRALHETHHTSNYLLDTPVS